MLKLFASNNPIYATSGDFKSLLNDLNNGRNKWIDASDLGTVLITLAVTDAGERLITTLQAAFVNAEEDYQPEYGVTEAPFADSALDDAPEYMDFDDLVDLHPSKPVDKFPNRWSNSPTAGKW